MSVNHPLLQQPQIKVEIRPSTHRRAAVKLVPYEDRHLHTGFTSVYGFGPEAVSIIESTGSTSGLKVFAVYADVLYVDFDDCPEGADEMIEAMKEYQMEVYHSGNRSVHLHIAIHPMYGSDVPRAQKAWMEKNFSKADMSIYQTAGMYRLPGTYHSKNRGHKKELTHSQQGELLKIERYAMPIALPRDEDQDLGEVLDRLLSAKTHEGGRNKHLYKICITMANLGVTYDEAESTVRLWNQYDCEPSLTEVELLKTLHWAFKGGM